MSVESLENILSLHKVWTESNGKKGEKANFQDMDFQEYKLKDLDLREVNLKNANFTRTYIENCNFENCNFEGSNFSYSICNNLNFSNSNLTSADFDGVEILNFDFSYANLSNANFSKIRIINSTYNYSYLDKTDFSNSEIVNTCFKSTILNNTDFNHCILREVNFSSAHGKNTIFDNAKLPLSIINSAVLETPSFDNTDITTAYFEEVTIITEDELFKNTIGVASEFDVEEVFPEDDQQHIGVNAQLKLLRQSSKIFLILAITIGMLITISGYFEAYSMYKTNTWRGLSEYNYLLWLGIFTGLLSISLGLKFAMFTMRRKDHIKKVEDKQNILKLKEGGDHG